MSARSLSAGKDNANDLLLHFGSILTLFKGDFLLAVSVGEQCLDLLLISNTLCFFAFLYADICNAVSEHARKLGSILISGFL